MRRFQEYPGGNDVMSPSLSKQAAAASLLACLLFLAPFGVENFPHFTDTCVGRVLYILHTLYMIISIMYSMCNI